MNVTFFMVSILTVQFLFADYTYSESFSKLSGLIRKVDSSQISSDEALLAIDEMDIELLLRPSVVLDELEQPISSGFVACRGAASGVICFDSKKLEEYQKRFGSVIWVTNTISNDDLCYIQHASGVCALKEDPSSHAIIVTRVNNVPCITLLEAVTLSKQGLQTKAGILEEGEVMTMDAFNGAIYPNRQAMVYPSCPEILNKLFVWCDQYAVLSVHANADTALEAEESLLNGALGVDPRSEHMFFHPDSLKNFRKVILQKELAVEELDRLKKSQKEDILRLFQIMKSYPVKMRLLDPPLHEFLPTDPALCQELANELGVSIDVLQVKIKTLSESNPMMGHRGVRLLLTFPEILKVQAQAIFEALADSSLDAFHVEPVIIIPMVVSAAEVIHIKESLEAVRKEVSLQSGKSLHYRLGVMIETPRACLLAHEITPYVDYFSFGTNDLTGLTFGFSRGDVFEKFLQTYFHTGILESNPFEKLDSSVFMLMEMAVKQARIADHYISIGICGEQASEKDGVFLCHKLGLDSVSTASQRIPSVRLFAAQAAILYPKNK